MPLAIDRKDEKGNITKGLWNSLSGILGAGSFDVANKENCWSVFHVSGHPFGLDHCDLITRVQGRYRVAAIDATKFRRCKSSILPRCTLCLRID